jgi:Amt family ammonium transporter
LLYGNIEQFFIQILGLVVVILFTGIMTTILYFITSTLSRGARADEGTEVVGLDEALHGERSFELKG